MGSVVSNYLRWFQLNLCKRELNREEYFPWRRRAWPYPLSPRPRDIAPAWSLPKGSMPQENAGAERRLGLDPAGDSYQSFDVAESNRWSHSEASKDHPHGNEYQ
jgi:hypothetical protein